MIYHKRHFNLAGISYLSSNKFKNKLKTNEDENSWKLKNNQPQPKIFWLL